MRQQLNAKEALWKAAAAGDDGEKDGHEEGEVDIAVINFAYDNGSLISMLK